jgi:hypothetical protein
MPGNSEFITVKLPRGLIEAVDKFVKTSIAHKNGIFSRSDFFTRAAVPWLKDFDQEIIPPPSSTIAQTPKISHKELWEIIERMDREGKVVMEEDEDRLPLVVIGPEGWKELEKLEKRYQEQEQKRLEQDPELKRKIEREEEVRQKYLREREQEQQQA